MGQKPHIKERDKVLQRSRRSYGKLVSAVEPRIQARTEEGALKQIIFGRREVVASLSDSKHAGSQIRIQSKLATQVPYAAT